MQHGTYEDFSAFWDALRHEDGEAWLTLSRIYGRLLLVILLREGIGEDDARELAQETFLRFWQRMHEPDARPLDFVNEKALTAYIVTIAKNEHAQRNRRAVFLVLAGGDDVLLQSDPDDAERRWEEADERAQQEGFERMRAEVERALVKLKNEEHAKIFLDRCDGKTNQEIAAERGMSDGNVRVIVYRVRAYLTNHFARQS